MYCKEFIFFNFFIDTLDWMISHYVDWTKVYSMQYTHKSYLEQVV